MPSVADDEEGLLETLCVGWVHILAGAEGKCTSVYVVCPSEGGRCCIHGKTTGRMARCFLGFKLWIWDSETRFRDGAVRKSPAARRVHLLGSPKHKVPFSECITVSQSAQRALKMSLKRRFGKKPALHHAEM